LACLSTSIAETPANSFSSSSVLSPDSVFSAVTSFKSFLHQTQDFASAVLAAAFVFGLVAGISTETFSEATEALFLVDFLVSVSAFSFLVTFSFVSVFLETFLVSSAAFVSLTFFFFFSIFCFSFGFFNGRLHFL
jgi:hypothetical protein